MKAKAAVIALCGGIGLAALIGCGPRTQTVTHTATVGVVTNTVTEKVPYHGDGYLSYEQFNSIPYGTGRRSIIDKFGFASNYPSQTSSFYDETFGNGGKLDTNDLVYTERSPGKGEFVFSFDYWGTLRYKGYSYTR